MTRFRLHAPVRRAAMALVATVLVAACGASATPAPSAAIPADALELTGTEYAFAPPSLSATAGEVSFAVTNGGTENHEFEVLQGATSLGKIEAFAPQATKTLTVTLAAGDYTFACRLNGHDILGMKGTLTVTGG